MLIAGKFNSAIFYLLYHNFKIYKTLFPHTLFYVNMNNYVIIEVSGFLCHTHRY